MRTTNFLKSPEHCEKFEPSLKLSKKKQLATSLVFHFPQHDVSAAKSQFSMKQGWNAAVEVSYKSQLVRYKKTLGST